MNRLLKVARAAWEKGIVGIGKFSATYVDAVRTYGDKAKEAFRAAYPVFGPREWKRIEMVGSGKLSPELFFKSDSFIGKLMKMRDSKRIQNAIIKAVQDKGEAPSVKATRIAGLVRKVNKAHDSHGRSARRILSEMAEEIVRYSHLRDDEWEFEESHGDRAFWNEETEKEHSELLGEIQDSRDRLTKLVREATGDRNISV